NLTAGADTTQSGVLAVNQNTSFQGAIKRGKFDLSDAEGLAMLAAGGNPHGRPNSDVLIPYVNGLDVTRKNRNFWIIDFNSLEESEASLYSEPFKHVLVHVRPER